MSDVWTGLSGLFQPVLHTSKSFYTSSFKIGHYICSSYATERTSPLFIQTQQAAQKIRD